jgi:histidine kinase
VALPDLLRAVCERLQPQYEDKGVDLHYTSPAEPLFVCADPHRVSQVLTNLLGNALQYTPQRGHVDLSLRRENGLALVSVADTGIGLSAEHLPHVFERFYRVDNPGHREAAAGSVDYLTASG